MKQQTEGTRDYGGGRFLKHFLVQINQGFRRLLRPRQDVRMLAHSYQTFQSSGKASELGFPFKTQLI
jgi:hypothetical protein